MEQNTYYNNLSQGSPDERKVPEVKIPIWVLALLLLSLGLAAVSMIRFPGVLKEYKCYRQAEERMAEGETAEALNDLLLTVERHSRSVPMITKLIDLSMKAGYYDLAAYVFDTYLVGKELSDSQYADMMQHRRRLEAYFASCKIVDELMAYGMAETASEEEADLQTAMIVESLEGHLKDPESDKAVLYYFLGLFSGDLEEQYTYLQQCYLEEPQLYDVRVQLANATRRRGNLSEAEKLLNEALLKEREDVGALRAMAILYMLRDDLAGGLELAQRAYELDPEGVYVRDTYLVALHANGMEEEKARIIEEMGEELEEDTQEFLSGACSLWDYYTE